MKLSYAVINFDEFIARDILDNLIKIPPFNHFFNPKPRSVELNLGDAPVEQSWLLNTEEIANRNLLDSTDTTNDFGERRVVFTNNRIHHVDIFPSPLLYGLAMPHYGYAFVRPVRPKDLFRKITLPDASYALELVAHELGGTLIYSPGEWEDCTHKKCFAFGRGKQIGNIIHPPRGRNHFCKQHQTYMIDRFTHQGRFFGQDLEKYCKDKGITI